MERLVFPGTSFVHSSSRSDGVPGPVAGRCGGENLWEFSSGSLYFLSGILSQVLMGQLILEV